MNNFQFDNLSKEQQDQIIIDGIQFMRTITEIAGEEHGMNLWNGIVDTLDPSVKGAIFFALITGHTGSRIRIRYANSDRFTVDRIEVIKAIRSATGLSLKEAKDLSDLAFDQQVEINNIRPGARQDLLKVLRKNGYEVC
ncbi:MAG: ribosomal protein L7/L12 [Fischerella sp.]|nr:ribosomal protein L7/L12 [Fischerella sp.]